MFVSPVPCGRDLLVAPSCDGAMYGLDPHSGKRIWRMARARGAYHSCPVRKGGTIYAGNDDKNFYAVNARTGKVRWVTPVGSGVWTRPLLIRDRAVFATLDGRVHALSLKTGEVLWQHKAGRDIYLADPMEWKGQVLIGTTDGYLRALDLRTGKRRWSKKVPGSMAGGLSIQGNTAFFVLKSGIAQAMDLTTRKVTWTRRLRGGTIYAPALHRGRIFIGTGAGIVYALDSRTGEVAWRHHSQGRQGYTTAHKGTLYAFSWNGRAFALSPEDGSVQWTLRTDKDLRGYPAFHGGKMFIGSLDFHLYAVDLEALGPRP